jgi:hypothetical protein
VPYRYRLEGARSAASGPWLAYTFSPLGIAPGAAAHDRRMRTRPRITSRRHAESDDLGAKFLRRHGRHAHGLKQLCHQLSSLRGSHRPSRCPQRRYQQVDFLAPFASLRAFPHIAQGHRVQAADEPAGQRICSFSEFVLVN